jgi:hypothetical protein
MYVIFSHVVLLEFVGHAYPAGQMLQTAFWVALQLVCISWPATHTVHAAGWAAPPRQYESGGHGMTEELVGDGHELPGGQGWQTVLEVVVHAPAV